MGSIFTSSDWQMICNTPGALQGMAYLGIPLGGFDPTGPRVSFRNNVVNSSSIISYSHKLHWGWAIFGYVWVYLMMSGAKLTLGPIVPLHIERAKQRPKCPKILARVARCHHDQRSHSATSTGAQALSRWL